MTMESAGTTREVLVLADLDDTCFQTERKCAPDQPVTEAAWSRDGTPLSFQSQAQATLVALLRRSGTIVPVTGRNQEALDRTMFRRSPFSITSFGAVIHTPGGPDRRWEARARDLASEDPTALRRVHAAVSAHAGDTGAPVRHSLVLDAGAPRYVSVKATHAGEEDHLALLLERLRERGDVPRHWQAFRTDRSLALAPPYLGKEHAVRYFLDEIVQHRSLTIGIGDNWSDAPFLGLCDFAMTPSGSALFSGLLGRGLGHVA